MSPRHRAILALAVPVLALACSPPGAETPEAFERLSPEVVAQAVELRESALESSDAYAFLRALTVEVGPRSAGSDGDRRAAPWAVARLEAMGLSNVRAEKVVVPHWERGEAAAWIVAPHRQPLVAVALGGSVGTPDGGLEAEVVEVDSLEALEALDAAEVAGKIVFFNRRMERRRDGSGYVDAVPVRTRGAARAGALGAAAVVIRSVGTSGDRFAHTGTTRYEDGGPRIPAAALAHPDADLLAAQLAAGEPVRLRLELGCRWLGDAVSANVLGEVPGREEGGEVVLLAAHLDSWDLGTGAIDDGLGCAVVSEAASWIARHAGPPRRTIRVLLTANEEFGLSGARAYAERYRQQLEGHVVALESDFGLDEIWALRSRVEEGAMPLVRDLVRLVAPLGVEYQGNQAFGGADLGPLRPARVPFLDLPLDGSRYFDYHHTANDTLDKVDPAVLRQAVATYAAVVYALAETEGTLGRAPAED